jgi:hypothetical protein
METLKMVLSAVGAVGGLLGVTTFLQGQGDRRKAQREATMYQAWLGAIEQMLHDGPATAYRIAAAERAWAARAFAERRLPSYWDDCIVPPGMVDRAA